MFEGLIETFDKAIDGLKSTKDLLNELVNSLDFLVKFFKISDLQQKFNQFESENVKLIFTTMMEGKGKEELEQLDIHLTKDETKEYMTKWKQYFVILFILMPNDVKIERMQKISEISLREPIEMTQPLLFIEYMVLANLTEPFASSKFALGISLEHEQGKISLDDWIDGFVNKEIMDVDWAVAKVTGQPIPAKSKSASKKAKKVKPAAKKKATKSKSRIDELIAIFDQALIEVNAA